MNDIAPPPPIKGRMTKADQLRYSFLKRMRGTPISIKDVWNMWPEIRRTFKTRDSLALTIRRLSGGGCHLLSIVNGPYPKSLKTYFISLDGIRYLRMRGYLDDHEYAYARRKYSYFIEDVLPPGRVRRVLSHMKGQWGLR